MCTLQIRVRENPGENSSWLQKAGLVGACFLLAAQLLLSGCATQPARPVLPASNIPAEVAQQMQRAIVAWNGGDLAAFLAMYADAATFAVADGFLVGRPAIREFYAPNFAPGATRDELSFERLDVEVLSPDTALVRGIYRNTRLGQVNRRGATTLVFRRIAGQWQVIHDHTN